MPRHKPPPLKPPPPPVPEPAPMRIDLHLHDARDTAILRDIQASLTALLKGEKKIMARLDDVRAALVEANEVTNEIASDVDELVRKATEGGGLSDEDVTQAQQLTARLRAVASAYTAETLPPVEG